MCMAQTATFSQQRSMGMASKVCQNFPSCVQYLPDNLVNIYVHLQWRFLLSNCFCRTWNTLTLAPFCLKERLRGKESMVVLAIITLFVSVLCLGPEQNKICRKRNMATFYPEKVDSEMKYGFIEILNPFISRQDMKEGNFLLFKNAEHS